MSLIQLLFLESYNIHDIISILGIIIVYYYIGKFIFKGAKVGIKFIMKGKIWQEKKNK